MKNDLFLFNFKMKVVLNSVREGNFELSNEAIALYSKYNNYKKHIDGTIDRHDVILLQVIDELNECANTDNCKFVIAEIPDGIEYEIKQSKHGFEYISQINGFKKWSNCGEFKINTQPQTEQEKAELLERENKIRKAFQVFDKKKNGYISIADFKYFMTKFGEKLEEREVDEMLKEVKTEGHQMKYDNFIKVMLSK